MTGDTQRPVPNSAGQPSDADFYRVMTLIRQFEERVLQLFAEGKLMGTTHTYIGQEANAAGLLSHLTPDDVVFSNHRCHGHYLALTGDVRGLLAELMGLPSGLCGGKGGSQHLCRGNFYTNGVQGGIVPVAVGAALAEKRLGRPTITVAFLGDGTLGEGVVYEAMNIASLWGAPILFVVENNHYAQTTPISAALAGSIPDRARAFGIDTLELHTSDPVEIWRNTAGPVRWVREERRPFFLVLHTYRFGPHSKGDDFRDPRELAEIRRHDPLDIVGRRLAAEERARLDRLAGEAIDRAQAELEREREAIA